LQYSPKTNKFLLKVDRHCNRLDADLVKFEEDQSVGDSRITTLPGLQPSARNLKHGADIRERTTKRLLAREQKEVKGDRKSKRLCVFFFIEIKKSTHFF
jgi:hypothetical protein